MLCSPATADTVHGTTVQLPVVPPALQLAGQTSREQPDGPVARMGGQASKDWVYSPVEGGDGALLLHSLDRDTAGSSEDEELYSADDNPGAELECGPGEEAGWWATLLQILFPFLLAGLGMVAAGLVLDIVQVRTAFIINTYI